MPLIINISAMQNETDVSFNMEDAKSYIESFSLLMEGYEKTKGKGSLRHFSLLFRLVGSVIMQKTGKYDYYHRATCLLNILCPLWQIKEL